MDNYVSLIDASNVRWVIRRETIVRIKGSGCLGCIQVPENIDNTVKTTVALNLGPVFDVIYMKEDIDTILEMLQLGQEVNIGVNKNDSSFSFCWSNWMEQDNHLVCGFFNETPFGGKVMEKKEEKKKDDRGKGWVKQGSYMGRSGNYTDYQKMLDEAARAPVKVEPPRDFKPEPPPNVLKKIIKKVTGK